MSRRIPLFPLPGVVLLPGTLLPLHIFEPRYRTMVADALSSDRTIGMAMLKPGWQEQGELPGIYPMGGAGEIVEAEELPDGRYNIVLEGRFRYRVLRETQADAYRMAQVEEAVSLPFTKPQEEARVRGVAERLFRSLRDQMDLSPLPQEAMFSERLSSEIALRLRYPPEGLQTILETDALADRFDSLIGRMREWQRRIQFLAPFRRKELDVAGN